MKMDSQPVGPLLNASSIPLIQGNRVITFMYLKKDLTKQEGAEMLNENSKTDAMCQSIFFAKKSRR